MVAKYNRMKQYTIKEADITKDKEKIISLLKSDQRCMSNAIYKWKYLNYPYGAPRVWFVIHNKTDEIVGSGSLFPRKLSINGKMISVANPADLVIKKKHRSLFPALKLEQEVINQFKKNDSSFIYSHSKENTKPVFARLGYEKIGNYKQFVKLLKIRAIPDKHLPSFLNLFFVKIILDLFLPLFSKEYFLIKKYDYNIEILKKFDARFDKFYESISKQFDIIGDRGKKYLSWRYTSDPRYDYRIFCLTENNIILGYIIFINKDNTYYIDDFAYRSNYINPLITEFIFYSRKNEIGAIEFRYMGNYDFIKKLKKYNFFNLKSRDREILLYSDKIKSKSYLLDNSSWHFLTHDKNV